MNLENAYKSILSKIRNGKEASTKIKIRGITYIVKVLPEMNNKGINFPSIIFIPKVKKHNNQIILESNNFETDNLEILIHQASQAGLRLTYLTSDMPAPIIIPILPSYKDGPYFQQLSKDSIKLNVEDKNYRIDEQVVRLIDYTKKLLQKEYGIKADNKIFLNGYSSSGVFAQRFAFIHPELVETACIGGASGSIPIPTDIIGYPLGIKDFEELFNKEFDLDNYRKIDFNYYVGELETTKKANDRFDEQGMPAPMHDMSYYVKSIPKEVGEKQRSLLGTDLFERTKNTIDLLRRYGVKIKHTIIPGRTHNDDSENRGVNELGDIFINDIYRLSLKNKEQKESR